MAKAPKAANHPQIVTANHLATGDVVYLGRDGGWSRAIDEAAVAAEAAQAETLLAAAHAQAKANIVVAPYLVPVKRSAATLEPVQFRERIRAAGPTATTAAS